MTGEVYHPTTLQTYERLRRVARAVFAVLARTTLYGLEHVPATGPFIATVNHLSAFDPPLVFNSLPRQGVVFIASKHKRNPLFAATVRMAGCIWVERGEADRAALKAALEVLSAGLAVGIAPEGTRSPTHTLQTAKLGAAYLATRANVPIVPVAIWGVEELKKSMRRLRRGQAFLSCGPAYCLPKDPRAKGETLETYTTEIMCRIAALLPEKYRGVYAGNERVGELIRAGG